MSDVLASHAPIAASGIVEPGVDHRPSGLRALMRPIEAGSAALLVALIGLVRKVLRSPPE